MDPRLFPVWGGFRYLLRGNLCSNSKITNKKPKLITMKKIIILFLLALPVILFAQEEVNWDFPVKPGSEEWKAFQTSDEMVESCQIPNDILQSLSTEKLLNLCLRYPMFLDIHFANNLQDGLNIIIPSFNGFVELLSRKDCPDELLNLYSAEIPCDVQQKKGNNTLRLFYLELLMSHEQIINKLDEPQRKHLLQEALAKLNTKINKKHSVFYELSSALILTRLVGLTESKDKIQSDKWLDSFNQRGTLIDSMEVSKIIEITQEFIKNNE